MTTNYNEASITVHQGLDGVRAKPGMYIGTPDSHGMFQCTKEIIDNAIDECLAGYSNVVAVSFTGDTFYVYDNGRGIPVGIHPTSKISTLTTIFTTLHAGGKMKAKDSSYQYSVGTHGVGSSVTNALSANLNAYTYRNSKWYGQQFKCGKAISKVKKINRSDLPILHPDLKIKGGTLVSFTLDKSCFQKGSKITTEMVRTWFSSSCYLHPTVKFLLIDDGKVETFYQPSGLFAFKQALLTQYKSEPIGDPFTYKTDQVDVVLQWSSYENEAIKSYVNGSQTADGGTHLVGLCRVIVDVLKDFKKQKDDFRAEDLRSGLIGALNLKIASPQFDNQTKDKLITATATGLVYDTLLAALRNFFKKRKGFAKEIITRANCVRDAQNQLKMSKKAAAKLKRNKHGRQQLPVKLVSSTTSNPLQRELLICEGSSASGCFVSGTAVKLLNGKIKTFEEMVRGHQKGEQYKGIGYNLKTEKFEEFDFIEPRITKEVAELIEVEMSDGTIVKCTTDHPWLLESGKYTAAEDLKPGDKLKVNI